TLPRMSHAMWSRYSASRPSTATCSTAPSERAWWARACRPSASQAPVSTLMAVTGCPASAKRATSQDVSSPPEKATATGYDTTTSQRGRERGEGEAFSSASGAGNAQQSHQAFGGLTTGERDEHGVVAGDGPEHPLGRGVVDERPEHRREGGLGVHH